MVSLPGPIVVRLAKVLHVTHSALRRLSPRDTLYQPEGLIIALVPFWVIGRYYIYIRWKYGIIMIVGFFSSSTTLSISPLALSNHYSQLQKSIVANHVQLGGARRHPGIHGLLMPFLGSGCAHCSPNLSSLHLCANTACDCR